MKLVMDLVVNHTSDEHEWFQKSPAAHRAVHRLLYLAARESPDGKLPNNWDSHL